MMAEPTRRPVWQFHGVLWRCVVHQKYDCGKCKKIVAMPTQPGEKGDQVYTSAPPTPYKSSPGYRAPLSAVGQHTDAGLACPKCGSTQFTAKRSVKGKLVAGVLAPKTQVKCVACGTMFKRG